MSESTTQKRFTDFQLADDVQAGIRRMGFEVPTPIQELCIGPILEGRDVVGKAETGTGKTLGFVAPLVGKLDTQRVATQALVLTPTRELAKQVAEVVEELGQGRTLGVVMLVGGVHASEQLIKLRSGSQIVVGTPGRVLDFLRERLLSLVWCETVVLDEADRMLDMGFIDDVTEILNRTPAERQTLLFSATVPPEIHKLLTRYMKDPLVVSTSKGTTAAREIDQKFVEASPRRKFKELCKILDHYPEGPVIVFCNTRRRTIDVDRMLWGHGYSAGALHGDQEQEVRFKVLAAFRQGQVKCLVCTDVASRGLDIDEVSCVVNYDIPEDEDSYVHRIGRTGRAQRTGVAISIVGPQERFIWQRIQRCMEGRITRWGRSGSSSRRTDGETPSGERRPGRRPRGGDRRRGERDRGSREPGSEARQEDRSRGGRSSRRRRSGRRGERSEARPSAAAAEQEHAGETEEALAARGSAAGDKEAAPSASYSSPRPAERSAAKKKLKKLAEIDDDFVKTDYFDIDETVIHRSSPKPAAEGGEKSSDRSRGGRGGRSGRDRSRGSRGRGGSRGGRGGRARPEESGAAGAEAPSSADSGDPAADATEAGGAEKGAKRKRPPRRRRPRRRSAAKDE